MDIGEACLWRKHNTMRRRYLNPHPGEARPIISIPLASAEPADWNSVGLWTRRTSFILKHVHEYLLPGPR